MADKKTKNPFEEFEKIRKKSGHNFHLKIANEFRRWGWEVEISPYYNDELTNKPREVDLVVSKKISVVNEVFGNALMKEYYVNLFIECKHLEKNVVFWSNQSKEDVREKTFRDCFFNFNEIESHIDQIKNFHRYFNNGKKLAAKLYETSQTQPGTNQDIIFSAVTQSIKSLIFFKDYYHRTGLYYPVVVYEPSGKVAIYSTENDDYFNIDEANDFFPVEINYSYRNTGKAPRNENFFIDFVSKNALLMFKMAIDKEIEEINKFLKFDLKSKTKPD